MNMKPDLTRPVGFTTYNGTDKVCTRDGHPWHKFTEEVLGDLPVAGYVEIGKGQKLGLWSKRGCFHYYKIESVFDLFYALPEKVEKTFWIMVAKYEIKNRRIECDLYDSKKLAELHNAEGYQIVPITLTVEE